MDRRSQGQLGLRRAFIAASAALATTAIYLLSRRVPLPFPALALPVLGGILLALGAAAWLATTFAERAEPGAPPTGIYAWLPEPALLGAALIASGGALATGSAHFYCGW